MMESRHFSLKQALKRLKALTLLAGLAVGWNTLSAAPVIRPQDAATPAVDPGELLLGELNCVACHTAEPAVRNRLAARQAPILGSAGVTDTPQFLRAFLLDPQTEKPGTTMPDVLHGMSSEQRAEASEALVHYLISLEDQRAEAGIGADTFKIREGRRLYHQVGCVACHAPQEPAAAVSSKESNPAAQSVSKDASVANLEATSVPLSNLSKKTTVTELAKFLIDPLKTRPSGRMPSLNLTEKEATLIAMYMLRDQAPSAANLKKAKRIQGLDYQYFEGDFSSVTAPDYEKLDVTGSGSTETFSLTPRRRDSNFALRYSGFITVPTDGNYTFFTQSDDGSRLYIGDQLVVNNDGQHAMGEKSGSIELKAGEHPIVATYFQGGADFDFKVFYRGPNIKKQQIPAAMLSHIGLPMTPLGTETFTLDAAKASRGKELFGSLGCAACHQVNGQAPSLAASVKSLEALRPDQSEGCLAATVKPELPDYQLDEAQRKAMRETLAHRGTLAQPLSPADQISRTMAALSCFACHSRDGVGGPNAARAEYFSVNGEADLGDEGRIPPHLTKVGDKLLEKWLREVLTNKGTVRPYMAARMPQFGSANVGHLPEAFEKADSGGRAAEAAEPASEREIKYGRKLVGRDGVSCISCHTFAGHKSLGIPAMDLTVMAKRLKKEWFQRYVVNPAALRPGTRMPSFWPDGQAINKEIFNGDTTHQINALWAYLSQGSAADLPNGLIQAKMELVADKEAIIYRNFIEEAGSRAIGVGYPEKANLAFDANDVRLAMIWQGGFIDASRHRSDRGVGFEPPLGDHVVKLPAGPEFAILPEANAPWPQAAGKKGGYRMKGYRLDEKRQPAFLYAFGSIEIEDYPVAIPGELDPHFNRTLTLKATNPAEHLWFRAATGSKIEEKNGAFVVDDKLTLKIQAQAEAMPLVRESNGHAELLVPVTFESGAAKIVENFVW